MKRRVKGKITTTQQSPANPGNSNAPAGDGGAERKREMNTASWMNVVYSALSFLPQMTLKPVP